MGEHDPDNDYIGPITFYPDRGFPIKYFPAGRNDQPLPPLVAVQFEGATSSHI